MSLPQMFDRTCAVLNRIDSIYAQSPTARALTNRAPELLGLFRDLHTAGMQYKASLEQFMIARESRSRNFQKTAPEILRFLQQILNDIRSLQASVRECAQTVGSDPNADIVIRHTDNQIQQQMVMFHNLSLQLLKSM